MFKKFAYKPMHLSVKDICVDIWLGRMLLRCEITSVKWSGFRDSTKLDTGRKNLLLYKFRNSLEDILLIKGSKDYGRLIKEVKSCRKLSKLMKRKKLSSIYIRMPKRFEYKATIGCTNKRKNTLEALNKLLETNSDRFTVWSCSRKWRKWQNYLNIRGIGKQ